MGLDILEVAATEYAVVELEWASARLYPLGWRYLTVFFPGASIKHSKLTSRFMVKAIWGRKTIVWNSKNIVKAD